MSHGVRQAPTMEMLRSRRDEILAIAARHGASNVRVFGSVVRGDADGRSDLDFLVEFEHGRSLFDLAALADELEALLGVRVDVGTRLKDRVRARVEAEAQSL